MQGKEISRFEPMQKTLRWTSIRPQSSLTGGPECQVLSDWDRLQAIAMQLDRQRRIFRLME